MGLLRIIRLRLVLVQVLIGGTAVVVLLARNDLFEALRGLPHLRLGWAAAAITAFATSRLLHGARWRFLLRHRRGLPFRWLLGLFVFANFVNALVPFRLGDVLRVELPSRRFGIPRTELASNVLIVESLFDGISFVFLLLASLSLIDIPPSLRAPLLLGALAVVALFVLAGIAARGGWRSGAERGGLLPRRVRVQLARRLDDLIAGMATLGSLRSLALGVAISIVGWLLEVLTYWLLARAFGLDLTFAQTLLVTVAANMATAIPLTPWNVGPYELVVSELLIALGVDRGAVSQYAVGSHVLLVSWITLTGLIAMFAMRLSADDLRRPAQNSSRTAEVDRGSARQ